MVGKMPATPDNWYRPLSMLLAGVVITGIGHYLLIGRDVVTRAEAQVIAADHVAAHSNVVGHAGMVDLVRQHAEGQDEIRADIREILERTTRVEEQLKIILNQR